MNNTLEEKRDYTANAVKRIVLHKKGSTWMFNDEILGLIDESFVLGASEAIQDMIDNHPTLENKVNPVIIFGEELPEFDAEISLTQDLGSNAWYEYTKANGETQELWLCSVLARFFSTSPRTVRIKFLNS